MGQVTGLLRDEPTVKEVMDRIVAEAGRCREKMAGRSSILKGSYHPLVHISSSS